MSEVTKALDAVEEGIATGIKQAPAKVATSVLSRGSVYFPSGSYSEEFRGPNINETMQQHNTELRKAASKTFNDLRRPNEKVQSSNPQEELPNQNKMKKQIEQRRRAILEMRERQRSAAYKSIKLERQLKKNLHSKQRPYNLSNFINTPSFTRKLKNKDKMLRMTPKQRQAYIQKEKNKEKLIKRLRQRSLKINKSPSSTPGLLSMAFESYKRPELAGGSKRSASPLNNNRTVKRPRTNYNNNNEFEVELNEETATAVRAALQSMRRPHVHFPNNVNNTVKMRSHFNKTVLPNLVNTGASNAQINLAKLAYQTTRKKAQYPAILTSVTHNAAHKFAKFIEKINTITYLPEFSNNDLTHVFQLIDGLPYKTATKKMMMRRAYKLLAFRKSENENNTLKHKVLLLTPEQDAEIKSLMKINPENWN